MGLFTRRMQREPARALAPEGRTIPTIVRETIVANQALFEGPRGPMALDLVRELVNTGFSAASMQKAARFPDPEIRAVAMRFLAACGKGA